MSQNAFYTHPGDAKGPTYKLTPTGMRLVYPGETVPLVAEPAPAEAPANPSREQKSEIAELQKLTIAAIEEQLGALTDDELIELLKLEEAASQPRTTLVAKIEAEQLKRVAAQTGDSQ